MAEVLSQSQIDALLSAARSGEMDLTASKEKKAEKKYRKYDFNSPRKFTKDRLKMVGGVFENFTRVINSRINGMLHTTCEITVDSVEEQRYYEFSNALLVNAGKGILLINLLRIVGIQELASVIAAEAECHLSEVIRAEGEKFRLGCYFISGEGRPGYLNHCAHLVVQ